MTASERYLQMMQQAVAEMRGSKIKSGSAGSKARTTNPASKIAPTRLQGGCLLYRLPIRTAYTPGGDAA